MKKKLKIETIKNENAVYQKFEVLKTNRNKRFKYQEFFVEGVRNINGAIQNGWDITSFLYTKEKKLSDWARKVLMSVSTEINYELTLELMNKLSGKENNSELIAIVKMREDHLSSLKLSKNPMIALFDRPSNKGNLGTIIRSCDALGVEALILTGHCVDLYDPDVVISSMGSFFNLPVIRFSENEMLLQFLKQMKKNYPLFQTIGTTAHKEHALYDLDFMNPVMFMIGNETDGLSRTLKDCCDILATIPMVETSYASSFNVGCAATVMFYEARRQRDQYKI